MEKGTLINKFCVSIQMHMLTQCFIKACAIVHTVRFSIYVGVSIPGGIVTSEDLCHCMLHLGS